MKQYKRAHVKPYEGEINEMVIKNPNLKPKKLAAKIIKTIAWPKKKPSLESMIKRVRALRKKIKTTPEDKPWCMATLKDNPIPPEALPVVLRLQQITRGYPPFPETPIEAGTDLSRHPLTIREARWVARLYTLVRDLRSLHTWATSYAIAEQGSFLASPARADSYDSSNLDKAIFEDSMRQKPK